MISNLSTCGFHDVSNARTTCYILVTRAIDVGFHRITKQIFRFCYKYTGFVSTRQTNQVLFSLCFSFLFTPSWTFQALYRLNRVSARAQKFMQRTLTSLPIIPANDSQRANDLREFLYPANAILQFGIFPIAYVHLPKVDHSSSISLSDTWKVIVFRNWTDSNRIQVSRDLIMIYFTRSSSCLFILLIIDIKGRSLTINRIDTLIY